MHLQKKQCKFRFHTPLSLANHTAHTTNNTMTDYSTSAATTANAAANAAGGTPTDNDTDTSVSKDGPEKDSKDEASDDDGGLRTHSFVQQGISRTGCPVAMG